MDDGTVCTLAIRSQVDTRCEVDEESFPTRLCSAVINGHEVAVEVVHPGRGLAGRNA